MTERIAKHISNVTFEKCRVSRLILHFKIDQKDNVIFLWCSSLRIENDKILKPSSTIMHNKPLKLDSCLQLTD